MTQLTFDAVKSRLAQEGFELHRPLEQGAWLIRFRKRVGDQEVCAVVAVSESEFEDAAGGYRRLEWATKDLRDRVAMKIGDDQLLLSGEVRALLAISRDLVAVAYTADRDMYVLHPRVIRGMAAVTGRPVMAELHPQAPYHEWQRMVAYMATGQPPATYTELCPSPASPSD